MKKIHYAWFVCVGCALLMFCTSGLAVNAFTIYQPYILLEGGLSNAQSSILITVRNLFSCLGMLVTGQYYRRLSLRFGMLLAGLMSAMGFLTYGLSHSYAGYIAASALTGMGHGFGTMIPIAIVLEHWFLRERTLAIGICSAATGLSTLGIPSLLTASIARSGLSATFMGESAVIAALSLLSFLLVRDRPENLGVKPFGFGAEVLQSEQARHETGLKRQDWVLIVPMLLLLGSLTSVGYSHLTVHMNALGYRPSVTALAITVSGLALMVGKTGYGVVSDRLGNYYTNWLFGAVLLAGLSLCCLMRGSTPLLFLSMCLYGVGLGLTTVGMTAWVGDWSAEEQYDDNTRRFQIGYSGGALLFSTLPGILADRAEGSYVPAYGFFLLSAVAVIGITQWIYYRHAHPKRMK